VDSRRACCFNHSRFRTAEPGNEAIDCNEYVLTPDNGNTLQMNTISELLMRSYPWAGQLMADKQKADS